jgi:hypothetical protein
MAADTLKARAEAAIWERTIRFEEDLSPAAARALLKLKFSARDQKRITTLAAKARAGSLTADEERQTDAYERFGCVLDVLHSQARRALKRRRKAS